MPEPEDAGQSLSEHLFLWLTRNAPRYLDELRESFGATTAKEVLAYYLRTGDAGVWLGIAYRDRTGRYLPAETRHVLRGWVSEFCDGPDETRWIDRYPGSQWQPVTAAQLRRILPEEHLEGVELAHALRPLLQAIHAGVLDFGGERHAVRVFRRGTDELKEASAESPPEKLPAPPAPSSASSADNPASERIKRKNRVPGTADAVTRDRRALIPLLDKERQDRESGAATVRRLATEQRISLPGHGDRENMIRELVRVWNKGE
jgi:hypothetical protein